MTLSYDNILNLIGRQVIRNEPILLESEIIHWLITKNTTMRSKRDRIIKHLKRIDSQGSTWQYISNFEYSIIYKEFNKPSIWPSPCIPGRKYILVMPKTFHTLLFDFGINNSFYNELYDLIVALVLFNSTRF